MSIPFYQYICLSVCLSIAFKPRVVRVGCVTRERLKPTALRQVTNRLYACIYTYIPISIHIYTCSCLYICLSIVFECASAV